MTGWIRTEEESFLKHPLTRLVAGFLLTTVAGTYLTAQWKAKDWENQQRYLYEQERLKEAYKVLDSTVESVSNTLTAADDLVTIAIWLWDPNEREKELAERTNFWQEESREWRSTSRVVFSKLRIHFGEDAARRFQTIINKRRQLGVDMRGLLEKLQADDWKEHREAIQPWGFTSARTPSRPGLAATFYSNTLLTLQVLQSQHQVQPAAQFDVPRGLHLPVVV